MAVSGDSTYEKQLQNYDCSFAAGRARRKYFKEEVFCIFSPVYPTGSTRQPASAFNSGCFSVRLRLNRQPSLRQRKTPLFLHNYTQPGSGFTVR
ncbi:Hypp1241 [Branchiostoma lanceolatum]|uniref:Hypp1241 protein n=1 Tax=Branchiostoma lanceolatum TaxID=7740 RepID=A0A8J9ZGZ2_BRALA|nr:Hypp1241 [Branchiostoma lanceolatum]